MRFVTRARSVDDPRHAEQTALASSRPAAARVSPTSKESPGTIPSEMIRHLCLATAAVAFVYALPLLRFPIGLLFVGISGWVVARTLGASPRRVTGVSITLGLLVVLLATRLLSTPPAQHALSLTYDWAVLIYSGMLLVLILADVLDLAQARLGRERGDSARSIPKAESPGRGEVTG